MNTRILIVFLHIVFANMMLQAQSSNPVGAIPGVVDVSPMGAATYTIPIEVVPGTQGMQPNLSVVYNSYGGMGIFGMKWNLAGLSAITRCGQTPYYDGDMTAIQYNTNDRFALDGNRLLMQSKGNYGQTDVSYVTEIENFTRVIATGGTAGAPDYFIAYTDDGGIIEYGNTTGNSSNSKQTLILNKATVTLSWCVNKISDSNGNYMIFTYEKSDGEIRIKEINYTGNTSLSPYTKVKFDYTSNTLNPNTFFVGGCCIRQTKLLQTITAYYGSTEVRRYEFDYNLKIQGERTAHLKTIELYSENYSKPLNATTIDWGAQNTTIEVPQQINGLPEGEIITGDFDGDGYTDAVVFSKQGSWNLYLNDNNGSFYYTKTGGTAHRFYVYDLNMDGKDELIVGLTSGDGWWNFYNITLWPYSACLIGTFEDFQEVYFGKFHSNGTADALFYCQTESYNILGQFLGYKHKLFNMHGNVELSWFDSNEDVKLYVADVNGNGKDNIQIVINNTTQTYEYQSDILQLVKTDGFPTKWHHVLYGDFNGDGIKDALVFCKPDNSSYKWLLHLGKGDNTFIHPGFEISKLDATSDGSSIPTPKYPVIIADINGDGKDEIIQAGTQLIGSLSYLFLNNFISDGSCSITREFGEYPNYIHLCKPKRFSLGDFNGDGKVDILIHGCKEYYPYTSMIVSANKNEKYEFPVQITDGLGKKIKLKYNPKYFNAEHYIKYSINQTFTCYRKYFLPVLDSLQVSNGIENGVHLWEYDYDDLTFSLSRKTLLGFKKFSCFNWQEMSKEECVFDFGGPNSLNAKQTLLPRKQIVSVKQSNDYFNAINERFTIYNWGELPNGRFLPYCRYDTVKDFLSNTKIFTTISVNNVGRMISQVVQTYNAANANVNSWLHTDTTLFYYKGINLSTTNFYHQKTVPEKTIHKQRYANSAISIVDTTTYGYYPASAQGRLEWIRKGNLNGTIKTNYDSYSSTGVCYQQTVSAKDCESRIEKYGYDDTRRFVIQITNPAGHITKYSYDAKTGNKTSETDPNGLSTTYQYDAFGNLTKIIYPDNTQTTIYVNKQTATNPPNAKYYTTTTSTGKPELKIYYDVLGREVCRMDDGYYYQTVYNNKGQVKKTSGPFLVFGETDVIWREYTYDEYGRKLTEKAPYTDLTYSCPFGSRKVTVTDKLRGNIQSWKNYDALGRITEAKDDGGTITYAYSVFKSNNIPQHKTEINAAGATTTIISDLWGNRLSITDPDAGEITSEYNKFNELTKQTDARGYATNYEYDKLGRITQKKYTNAATTLQTLTYTYDLGNKAKGQLSQIKMDGIEAEAFTYDNYARLSEHKKVIERIPYVQKYSYSSTTGQLETLIYPDNFTLNCNYSSTGKLNEIRNGSDNSLIYKVVGRNRLNAPLSCEYGNGVFCDYSYNENGLLTRINTGKKTKGIIYDPGGGGGNRDDFESNQNQQFYVVDSSILNYRYAYDTKGLMSSRSESVINRLETYKYDNLDRLTQVKSGKIGLTGTAKAFSYTGNGNIEQYGTGFYSYQSNNKPHAVRQITPSSTVSPQTVTYNFFNQPTQITEGSSQIYLSYGTNQQRNKVVKSVNSTVDTRFYINKYYEKGIDVNNVTKHYHYIYGDNGVVAVHIANETASTANLYYIHSDHLGSYCVLTDAGKNVVQSNRFDPWGNNVGTANFALTYRGFTGHEHYPQFKIINMNGRLYDPVIGRFFSPDKYVANSSFTQDFNRYTYARNNPLMYTDPDGEFLWMIPVGIAISAALSAASYTISVAASSGGFQNWSWDAFGANMMMGIGQGLITSGIGETFGATGSMGAFGEIGRAGAHAVTSGLFSYAQDGNFWRGTATGFASSLIGSASDGLPVLAQMGVSTLVGGTISKATGGTFWQGAANGFLISALNHAAHGIEGAVENAKIRKYVNAMFPGRNNDNIKWKLWGNNWGETFADIRQTIKDMTTYLPEEYWNNRKKDNRLLIDCIDHELVHISDYASGLANEYYKAYGMDAMLNIMDYRAYSENVYYNQRFRQNNPIDHSVNYEKYKKLLPSGWHKY